MYVVPLTCLTIRRAHMRMNIQSLHNFGFVLTFVLFSSFLVASAVVGAVIGPTVLVENVAHDIDLSRVSTLSIYSILYFQIYWSGSVHNLTKLNQQLLLSVQIQNKHKDTGAGS